MGKGGATTAKQIKRNLYREALAKAPPRRPMPPLTRCSRWHVARVQISRIDEVLKALGAQDVVAYSPLERVIIRPVAKGGGRCVRIVDRRLFGSYVFVAMPGDRSLDFGRLEAVPGVSGLLRWETTGAPVALPEQAVLTVWRAVESGAYDATISLKTRKADRLSQLREAWPEHAPVVVTGGAFASFPGRVERVSAEGRISVLIAIFGRETRVELALDEVEAA